jgi:hypothetical protein
MSAFNLYYSVASLVWLILEPLHTITDIGIELSPVERGVVAYGQKFLAAVAQAVSAAETYSVWYM